ncbi:MAG: cysteine dioxygenase, partial [Bdellovibrionota bacterium]
GLSATLLASDANFLTESLSLAAPLPPEDEPYSRKIIYNGTLGDVMVARWRKGARCLPHDHGGAHGLVTVLMGEFFEQPFTAGEHFAPFGPELRFAQGDIEAVVSTEIHSLRAVTEGVTLHLYSPPIRGMKVYDEDDRIIYTVADNCGAWIPSDKNLILGRQPFGADPLHD